MKDERDSIAFEASMEQAAHYTGITYDQYVAAWTDGVRFAIMDLTALAESGALGGASAAAVLAAASWLSRMTRHEKEG